MKLRNIYLPPSDPLRSLYDAYLWLSIERSIALGEQALMEAVNAELQAIAAEATL